MENSQRNVVSLRKGVVVIVTVLLIAIVLLIIINVSSTVHAMHTKDTQQSQTAHTLVTEIDTNWYQNEVIKKSVNKKKEINNNSSQVPQKVVTVEDSVSSISSSNDAPSQSQKDLTDAMKAPITSNQLTDIQINANQTTMPNYQSIGTHPQQNFSNDQNMQMEKLSFVKEAQQNADIYLHAVLQDPVSPYELQAGAIIPAVLITRINSDLPGGDITAQVKSNVYDSVTGKYLLIPQGAKLEGANDSQIAYGQDGVLVVWKRIIYPNGQSLSLEGMPGVDMSGEAGFRDQVDNHYMKIFGSVVLMSMLGAGAQLSQPQQSNDINSAPSVAQTIAQSVGTNIANTGTMMTSKNLNIQPTIKIRQGYEFNIKINKDIIFTKPYA